MDLFCRKKLNALAYNDIPFKWYIHVDVHIIYVTVMICQGFQKGLCEVEKESLELGFVLRVYHKILPPRQHVYIGPI